MVTVYVTRNGKSIESVEISGHADSAPHGQDLVCAAVSAVSFGTYNAVVTLCQTELPVEQGEDGGYLYITVPTIGNHEREKQIQLLLEGMLVSLQTIENQYSEYITITEE